MIKNLEISDITLGSLKFMRKKDCAILHGESDIEAFMEFLFIHTRPIKTLRKLREEEYEEAFEEFVDSVEFSDLPEIGRIVEEKIDRMTQTEFFQANNGKKKV